jgi:putative transposase
MSESLAHIERGKKRVKRTRHSAEHIIAILKQGEAGLATADLCRQQGDQRAILLSLEGEVQGMDSGDAKKLKQLR